MTVGRGTLAANAGGTPPPLPARLDVVPLAAAVVGGAVFGYLVSGGLGYLALGMLLAPVGFVLLHRHPLVAVWVWLVVSPFVHATDGAAARKVYWLVHRGLPVAALAAVVLGAALGLGARRLPRLGWPEVLMAGYLVATLLSIAYTAPDSRAATYILYDAVFIPMCLYVLVRLVVPDEGDMRRLVPIVAVVLLSQSLIGLLSWHAPELLPPEWVRKAGQRTTGSLRSADVFGTTMLFCGMFVLHVGLTGARRRLSRAVSVLLYALALLMVFLTFSRATWLAGVVATTGLLFVYRRYVRQLAVVVVPLVFLAFATDALTHQLVLAQQRLNSAESEESALSRLPVALAAVRMVEAKPAAGWGYQNFDLFDRGFQGRVGDVVGAAKDHASHNLYLTTLAEQGAVGFVLLLGPVAWWLIRTRAVWPRVPPSGLLGRELLVVLWLVVASHVVVNNFSRMQLPLGLGIWWLTLGLIGSVVDRYRAPHVQRAMPSVDSTGPDGREPRAR